MDHHTTINNNNNNTNNNEYTTTTYLCMYIHYLSLCWGICIYTYLFILNVFIEMK